MKILRFNELIKEGYEEKPEYQIKSFFTELEKNIKYWFEQGAFASDEIELVDIKQINVNSVEKNLMFDFQDTEFYYQVIIIIDLLAVTEDGLEDCYIKVKKYNSDSELLRTSGEDASVDDVDQELIVQLFSKLDEESDSASGEMENDETLSDDDTDLGNTDIV